MEGFVMVVVLIAALAVFGLVAVRFGTDSRDTRWAILG
jgi:hypothetical protein